MTISPQENHSFPADNPVPESRRGSTSHATLAIVESLRTGLPQRIPPLSWRTGLAGKTASIGPASSLGIGDSRRFRCRWSTWSACTRDHLGYINGSREPGSSVDERSPGPRRTQDQPSGNLPAAALAVRDHITKVYSFQSSEIFACQGNGPGGSTRKKSTPE
jgi:hypothetical protein